MKTIFVLLKSVTFPSLRKNSLHAHSHRFSPKLSLCGTRLQHHLYFILIKRIFFSYKGYTVDFFFLYKDTAPTVRIEPERQTVGTGTTGSLRCIATGEPRPTIVWSRANGQLSSNHQV